MKGEEVIKAADAVIDIKVDAYIDAAYISQENQKIEMYKRIAAIEGLQDKYDVEEELEDRFGEIPKPAWNLVQIAYIKALASSLGFSEISHRDKEVRMKLISGKTLTPRTLMILLNENRNILRLNGSSPPILNLLVKDGIGSKVLEAIKSILEKIKDLQQS